MVAFPEITQIKDDGANKATMKERFGQWLQACTQLPGGDSEEALTIASGGITPSRSSVSLTSEGGATTDDLVAVSVVNAYPGSLLFLRPASGHTITVKHQGAGTDYIYTSSQDDVVLSGISTMVLRRMSSYWYEVGCLGKGFTAPASAASPGPVELATSAEALAGTDLTRALTPADLKAVLDSKGFWGTGVNVPTDSDLNTYTSVGFYYGFTSGSATIANRPFNAGFVLHVLQYNNSSSVVQVAYPVTSSAVDPVFRVLTGGTWTAWAAFLGAALSGKANTDFSNATTNAIGFYFYARDEKTAGTNGGTSALNAWQTRDLNTVKTNTLAGVSLSSNRVTLPAGKYRIRASAPAYAVNACRLAIYDYTHGSYLQYGKTYYAPNGNNAYVDTTATVDVVFSAQTTVEVRQYTVGTISSIGLGVANNISGVPEVYAEVEIWAL